MNKALRRQNLSDGAKDLEILVALDYQVIPFSEYHFRINNEMDVWPSSKKYMRFGQVHTYENLITKVTELYGKK